MSGQWSRSVPLPRGLRGTTPPPYVSKSNRPIRPASVKTKEVEITYTQVSVQGATVNAIAAPPRRWCRSDYLSVVLEAKYRASKVDRALSLLRKHTDRFDAFAVRGASGMLFGGILAHELHKDLILVRKDEARHSSERVEGAICWSPLARYLILDDFIATGETIRRIQRDINTAAECVGVYLYRDAELMWRERMDTYYGDERSLYVPPRAE